LAAWRGSLKQEFMSTESRNPRSIGLDKMSAQQIVRLMNEEEQAVIRALQHAERRIAEVAERVAFSYKSGGRIVYVGAGTSGRTAAADAAEMPPTFGIPGNRFIALIAGGVDAFDHSIEDAEDDEIAAISEVNRLDLGANDTLIGIAASGKTPFVVAAVRHARAKGIWTCGIANTQPSPLLTEAELPIFLDTGPEVLTGSTRLKAATAQKLVLNRISTAAMVLCGKVVQNLMIDVKATNSKLRERCVRIVRELTTLTETEAVEMLERNAWDIRSVLQAVNEQSSVST